MRFNKLELKGACIVDLQKHEDHRGFFARAFCQKEFAERGLATNMVQTNISYSKHRGTLRGLHYQEPPSEEAKLVRCAQGSVYDVIVDLRPDSPTFKGWRGVELSSDNGRLLYVPEGFAHGFLTLEDSCEVTYQVSEFYSPSYENGLRYNDPNIDIRWPIDVNVISDKDRQWPDFEAQPEVS